MGYATAGLSVSQMAGVPIGGYLAGISWHSPFFTISAASLVYCFLLIFICQNWKLERVIKSPLQVLIKCFD